MILLTPINTGFFYKRLNKNRDYMLSEITYHDYRLHVFKSIYIPSLIHQTSFDYKLIVITNKQYYNFTAEYISNLEDNNINFDILFTTADTFIEDVKQFCIKQNILPISKLDSDDAIGKHFVENCIKIYDKMKLKDDVDVVYPSDIFVWNMYMSKLTILQRKFLPILMTINDDIYYYKYRHFKWQGKNVIRYPTKTYYLYVRHPFIVASNFRNNHGQLCSKKDIDVFHDEFPWMTPMIEKGTI